MNGFRKTCVSYCLAVFAWLVLSGASVSAAILYWDGPNTGGSGDSASDGGSATWDTSILNWDQGNGIDRVAWTNANNDTAIFAGTAGTVSLGTGITVGGLQFDTASYIIQSNTLTWGTAGNIVANQDATIRSVMAGSVTVTKSGAGTVTLTANNTYSGGTTVNGGTLQAGDGSNASASFGPGTTTLSGGNIAYNYNNFNFSLNGAITLTAEATISKLNGVFQQNFTPGTLNGGGQTLNIHVDTAGGTKPLYFNQTAGTALGQVNILNGAVGEAVNLGKPLSGAAMNVSSGAQFRTFSTGTVNNNITLNGGAGPDGNGALWNEGSGTPTYTGTITLANGTDSGIGTSGGNMTISGQMTGGGSLIKMGANTLTLSGVNTYTGGTTVSGGTLVLSSTSLSPSYTVDSGAVLEFMVGTGVNRNMTNATLSGSGTLKKTGSGILRWGEAVATFSLSPGALIDVQAGDVRGGAFNNEDWTANYSDLNVASGALFNGQEANVRVNALTGSGTIRSGWDEGTTLYQNFTFGVANGSATFDGVLANTSFSNYPGNFVKTGTGTQVLAGASTYTGSTTVDAGTLKAGVASVASVSGAFGNNSAVTMANTAGAILDLDGYNTQIGSLSGGGSLGGSVVLGSAALTVGGDNTSPPAYAGVISGSGGLTKIGTGTQTLTGVNTFSGATAVNGGTLLVNSPGSLHANSAVNVASGSRLGGDGTVHGPVTVNGIVAPGDGGIGTLTVNSHVTWVSAATPDANTDWQYDLGAGDESDLLDISGNFTKSGSDSFRFDFCCSTPDGVYTLVQWGASTDFVAADFSATGIEGGKVAGFSVVGNQLLMEISGSATGLTYEGWILAYTNSMANPAVDALPGANPDDDDFINYEEFIADTDPTDPDDFFRLENLNGSGSAVVTFDSSTGRIYTLRYNTNLLDGSSWNEVAGRVGIPGTGPNATLTDTNGADRRSYRIEVDLP